MSVLTCFMSTLVPGIILCLMFCVVSAVMLRKDTDIQPVPKETPQEWVHDLGRKTWSAFPVLLFPVIILGGIYGGFMTPTESAAVGAFYQGSSREHHHGPRPDHLA